MNTIIEKIRAEIERLKPRIRKICGEEVKIPVEKVRKKFDTLLSFLDTIKEQPCEGLEEEIERVYAEDKFTTRTRASYSILARHFAKWQKEQDDKELSEKIASAYQLGLADKEKMMMKEAIDAEFCSAGMFMPMIDFKDKRMEGIKYGDTIKVIVIKEK